MHLRAGEVFEDIADLLQFDPVELDVLPRGEMPVAAVVVPGDVRQGAQLRRRGCRRESPRAACRRASAGTGRSAGAAGGTPPRSVRRRGGGRSGRGTAPPARSPAPGRIRRTGTSQSPHRQGFSTDDGQGAWRRNRGPAAPLFLATGWAGVHWHPLSPAYRQRNSGRFRRKTHQMADGGEFVPPATGCHGAHICTAEVARQPAAMLGRCFPEASDTVFPARSAAVSPISRFL